MGTMNGLRNIVWALVLAGLCFNTMLSAQTQGLLYQDDFMYVGSFKLPGGSFGPQNSTFDFANGQVAGTVYNDPVHGKTIFATGYLSAGYVSRTTSVAQVKIPVLKNADSTGIGGLNIAEVVQGFADPSNGKGAQALTDAGTVALVCYGGKLIGTENAAFDGSCSQTKSAWVAPVNFSQASQATGPYAFNASLSPRLLGGGYMTLIPPEWQAALGGKVVSGNGPWSIISCGSPGPALHVVDADLLISQPAVTTAIPLTPLVYYEDGYHSSLGTWDSNSPDQIVDGKHIPNITVTDPHGRGTFTIAYEDGAMHVGGVLFAEATRSVLFFGKKGLGPYCYGEGLDCGDLDDKYGKGDHSYPYTEFCWAYDVNDLIAVKNGQKQPWEVLPYTGWIPAFPVDDIRGRSVGVAWDPETRLAYMVVEYGWAEVSGDYPIDPIVHVYRVNDKSSRVEKERNSGNGMSISAAPNPFNPSLNISLKGISAGTRDRVSLQVVKPDGRLVADLTSVINNGAVVWNASGMPSGIYVVHARAAGMDLTQQVVLIK